MKITINEVAIAAGVSKGTVDRVLHNRGEVSRESREKVLKAVKELGFQPNMYASMLASKKVYRIVCLIPEFKRGEVWELTANGVALGADDVSRYGVKVELVTYDQYDNESFRAACDKILESSPSGVVLAPMFRSETLKFVRELKLRDIVYAYIDSKIDDDDYYAYFGMPMYQSGYLCASLMCLGGAPESISIVKIERDKKGLSDPTMGRRLGFEDYIKEFHPATRLKYVTIDPKNRASVHNTLDREYAADPSLPGHMVMFNSRVHLLASWLRSKGISGTNVIGFDMLENNIRALKDDTVKFLIAQHSDTQAAAAVKALVDRLLGQSNVSRRDNYTQMDIITKHNCDYYL